MPARLPGPLLLLCLCLCTALTAAAAPGLPAVAGAVAAEGQASASPAPPDPRALEPEWWAYFVVGDDPGGTQLEQRYAAFSAQLERVIATSPGEARAQLDELRAGIERHFGRYRRVLHTPPAPPAAPPAVQTRYPLEDVLELGRDADQLRRGANLEAQEIALIERSLALGRDEQDAAKLRYRELASGAPQRLLEGVRLIRDRLRIETLGEELRWRRAHQAALASGNAMLQQQASTAAGRIVSTPAALAAWRRVEQEATRQATAAGADLMKLQLSGSMALATSPDERAQARYHDVRTLRRGVEIGIAETRRASAIIAQRLLQRIAARNAAEPAPDRAQLDGQQALLDKYSQAAADHAARAAQLRGAIAIEREATQEAAAVAVYERARNTLIVVESALENLRSEARSGRQLAALLDARLREREGRVGQSVRMVKDALRSSVREAHHWLSATLFEINETPVTTLGLIRVLLILTGAWWLSKLGNRALTRFGPGNSAFNPASLYAVGRVMHYLLLTVGFVVGLSSIGVDLTKFALLASALGIGVGFGLQTLISNFVAGLIILFEKSMNVGDFIELSSGATGVVKEINMRATRITSGDNVDILVPNSEFMTSKVMNWTLEDAFRRIHVPFAVVHDADKEAVQLAALAAAGQVEHTVSEPPNRAPQVWLIKLTDTGMEFELVVWLNLRAIRKPGSVTSDYLWALDNQFRLRGIERPHTALSALRTPPPVGA